MTHPLPRGSTVDIHYQWKTEKGFTTKYIILEYQGVKLSGSQFPYYVNKKKGYEPEYFIGQKYLCLNISTGKQQVKYIKDVQELPTDYYVSIDEPKKRVTQEHVDDNHQHVSRQSWLWDTPDSITCTLEEVYNAEYNEAPLNRESKFLIRYAAKFNKRLANAKKLIQDTKYRNIAFYYVRHAETPTLRTYNTLRAYRKQFKQIYQEFIKQINS